MTRLRALGIASFVLMLVPFMTVCGEESSCLWTDSNIIDIHAHIGDFRGYDLSRETLLENVNTYNIRLALVSNIDGANLPLVTRNLDEEQVNSAVASFVREHVDRFRALYWAKPGTEDGESAAKWLAMTLPEKKERIFVGMKFHPQFNNFDADSEVVDSYLKSCAAHGIAAVFHCGSRGSHSSADKICNVAKRHPVVPVVLYHLGFDGNHDFVIGTVKGALDKGVNNVFVETAQASPEAVLKAIRVLGADRVLFGTDASYYGKNHYSKYEPMLELLKKELTDEDFNKVIRNNAIRVFKLK